MQYTLNLIRLAFKNVSARKSSYAIIFFVAFSIAALILGNALFDGTDSGVKAVFIDSFTGDIVIRPKSSMPLSLFGDETPITGELSKIDAVTPYMQIYEFVQEQSFVQSINPQVSGLAAIDINGSWFPTALFGVNAQTYMNAMPGIILEEGKPFGALPEGTAEYSDMQDAERGIMLPRERIEAVKSATGYTLKVGDLVQLIIADGPTFRIRAVPLTGIYSYDLNNETLNKIALIDAGTLRSLMNMSETTSAAFEIAEETQDLLSFDVDDLFADTSDVTSTGKDGVTQEDILQLLADEENIGTVNTAQFDTAWNFIILTVTEDTHTQSAINFLNRNFRKNNFPVEAVDWRQAAGKTALYMYWLRVIFNVGVYIVLCTGFIVVINSLIINVLDRIREIGTMRAIGADRRYISLLCMSETLMLTLTAGVLGIVLGCIAVSFLTSAHITFTNDFLIQMFGGATLIPKITVNNIVQSFVLSLALGFVAWIYPVKIALQTTPVVAMRGGS